MYNFNAVIYFYDVDVKLIDVSSKGQTKFSHFLLIRNKAEQKMINLEYESKYMKLCLKHPQ